MLSFNTTQRAYIMKRSLIFGFLVCLLTICNAEEDLSDVVKLSKEINVFSGRYYQNAALLSPGKNLITSPLSAHILLSLMSLGARGETQEEIIEALGLESENFTKNAYSKTLERLNKIEGVTLETANKIYVHDDPKYELNPDFKDVAKNSFYAEIESINFRKSDAAANIINSWVYEKTRHKIKDIIDPFSMSVTSMLLINAIYFKGNWNFKFDPNNTIKRDFHLNKTDVIQVDTMYLTANLFSGYLPEMNATVLEMPYEKKTVSMFIILPDEIDGLSVIEEKISTITDIRSRLYKFPSKVELYLPKFRTETTMDITKVLENVGVKKIFKDCDLGGMLKHGSPLIGSRAVQKAYIDVNEVGAEVAAVTTFYVPRFGGARINRLTFRVDRPFYYAIVNKVDNYQLFSGSLRNLKPN